ncbi:GGDEF domain-containing protein [Aliikangiella sp. IMCC44632]
MKDSKYKKILLNNTYIGLASYHVAFLIACLCVFFKVSPFSFSEISVLLYYLYPPLIVAIYFIKTQRQMSLAFSNKIFALLLLHWFVIFGFFSYFLGEMRPLALIVAFMGLIFISLYSTLLKSLIAILLVVLVYLISGVYYQQDFPSANFWQKEFVYSVTFIGSALMVGFNLHLVAKKIRNTATFDALTKLLNRRGFMKIFSEEFSRSRRYHQHCCLMMLDIDYFKKINDQLGHDLGDQYLKSFAQFLSHNVRTCDKVCRWGGEEFLVLLPQTSLSQACFLANRILAQANQIAPIEGATSLNICFSAGLVEVGRFAQPDAAINRADELLYQAKSQGRNQVVCDPS